MKEADEPIEKALLDARDAIAEGEKEPEALENLVEAIDEKRKENSNKPVV